MSKIKDALTSYESESGHSPISGVLNTLTFAKSLPIYVIMSLAIALVSLIGLQIVIWGFLEGWFLCCLFSIMSIFGSVYLAITGVFYFTMTNFIDNIKDVVMGTLEPIEKVYNKWSDKTTMSKKEFVIAVIKEEVFPGVLGMVPDILSSRLNVVIDNVLGTVKGDIDVKEYVEGVQSKLQGKVTDLDESGSIAEGFNKSFLNAREKVTKPYTIALKVYGGLSALIILLILI